MATSFLSKVQCLSIGGVRTYAEKGGISSRGPGIQERETDAPFKPSSGRKQPIRRAGLLSLFGHGREGRKVQQKSNVGH